MTEETPAVVASGDASETGGSQHKVFNESVIVILLMLMIFMVFESLRHKKNWRFGHESAVVCIIGITISAIYSSYFKDIMEFNTDLFFYFILPPIIFASGFYMYRKRFFANKAEEEETATIVDELAAQKLDVVKKAPNGNMLDPEYMVKLLNCITTSAKKRREGERNTALAARRELYKSESWDAYRENVQEQFMKENTMSETVMREALEHL